MMLDRGHNDTARDTGTSSFLVRLSKERGDRVRVYVRNLRTGEELYLGDPERVGEVLAKELEVGGQRKDHEDKSEAQAG